MKIGRRIDPGGTCNFGGVMARIWWAAAVWALAAAWAPALEPKDIFLVTNKNIGESRELAEHYCKKRGVPRSQILVLDLPTGEDISRADYNDRLAGPLRTLLQDRKEQVKVLLTLYGVPLRVGSAILSQEEQAELARIQKELTPLQKKKSELEAEIKKLEEPAKKEPDGAAAKQLQEHRDELGRVTQQHGQLEQRRRWVSHAESLAAVDSELALLWHSSYDLRRWQLNALYFQVPAEVRREMPPQVMTCRIDGPDVKRLYQLIDDSVAVEKTGLKGTAYFDARGIGYNPKNDTGHGYGGYDESLREAAQLLETEAKMKVVLDNKGELFAPGACTDCALYCGWYSHAKYIDCCRPVRGAVAYHIASSEATTLRNPKSTVWCPNLLQAGVAATLGPVSEPYTIGFPKPAEFFGFLVTGEFTLVECYWKTVYFSSWMTTLVGDPLYNPFQATPLLQAEQVKASPKGGVFPLVRPRRPTGQ
jgi:uncharacterized protein (TIGR03790 family)